MRRFIPRCVCGVSWGREDWVGSRPSHYSYKKLSRFCEEKMSKMFEIEKEMTNNAKIWRSWFVFVHDSPSDSSPLAT